MLAYSAVSNQRNFAFAEKDKAFLLGIDVYGRTGFDRVALLLLRHSYEEYGYLSSNEKPKVARNVAQQLVRTTKCA